MSSKSVTLPLEKSDFEQKCPEKIFENPDTERLKMFSHNFSWVHTDVLTTFFYSTCCRIVAFFRRQFEEFNFLDHVQLYWSMNLTCLVVHSVVSDSASNNSTSRTFQLQNIIHNEQNEKLPPKCSYDSFFCINMMFVDV